MSSTIFQSFQKKGESGQLPVSQPDPKEEGQGQGQGGIRRRLSCLSLKGEGEGKVQPAAASWSSFCRSKSVSSMGEYAGSSLRKWWDWSWAWILSRKPIFAKDLEMNQQEIAALGCHNKGSWSHVIYKLKSDITRLLGSNHNVALPL